MNGITELAKILKDRENKADYAPLFGTIIELPNIKIRLGDKVILTEAHLKQCISLTDKDSDNSYIHLGKEVVLLPYADEQNFIVIGVVQ